MHAVNVAGQALDHRVIEVIERREEPALLGLRRQAAEQVAQRLGAGAAAGRSAQACRHVLQLAGQQLSTRSGRGRR